ncbi:MAG: hypothetical protein WCD53_15320 [Microcoleus sp.]
MNKAELIESAASKTVSVQKQTNAAQIAILESMVEAITYQTYLPEVQKQIKLLLQYRGGKQMVKRYLAIIDSPQYLE